MYGELAGHKFFFNIAITSVSMKYREDNYLQVNADSHNFQ